MPDARGDMVNCEQVRSAMAQERALSPAESAHVEGCETCMEAWLDIAVTQALDDKPEVRVPADFAARVAAGLPEQRAARELQGSARMYERHWGLITAVLLVAIGLVAMAVADPKGFNTQLGLVFIAIIVSEIAGIALWLGTGRIGEGRK